MAKRNRRVSTETLDNGTNDVVDSTQNENNTDGKETEMAIAERELIGDETNENDASQTDETNVDNGDDDEDNEKTKRERVDLENLDPNTKVQFSIAMPAGLKLALLKRAEAETDSPTATTFSRNVLANLVGYEIPASFTQRKRRSEYATPEEAQKAAATKAKTQREQMKAFLAMAANDPEMQAKLAQAKAIAEAAIAEKEAAKAAKNSAE